MDTTHEVDFSSIQKLWSRCVIARKALLESKSEEIRSNQAAEADLAEWLVARLWGGIRSDNKSQQSFDVTASRMRIQVMIS